MSDETAAGVEPLEEELVAPFLGEHLAEESRRCSDDHAAFSQKRDGAITAYYGKVLRETLKMRADAYKAYVKTETQAILKELEARGDGGSVKPKEAGGPEIA